jgi:16S rRNA (uracil1498-N3)-methyltransferase
VRRFLVPGVPPEGELIALDEATSHHLLRVTGIAPGEAVEIFDGAGEAAEAALVKVEEGTAVLNVTRRWSDEKAKHTTHVLLGQTRAQVLDSTLRMVTELGVSSIQIVHMARSVAKGDKRERWLRIIASAAAQCGRTVLPDLHDPDSLLGAIQGREGVRMVMVPGAKAQRPTQGAVHLLVGPEGGITPEELVQVEAAGWSRAGLGSTVLRADTAAVAAVARYGA